MIFQGLSLLTAVSRDPKSRRIQLDPVKICAVLQQKWKKEGVNGNEGSFSSGITTKFFLFGLRGTGKSTWLKCHYQNAEIIDLLAPEVFRVYSARPERLCELVAVAKRKRIANKLRFNTGFPITRLATTMGQSNNDYFLFSYEIGDVIGKDWAVYASISAGTFSPKQGVFNDAAQYMTDFQPKSFAQSRFL